MHHLITLLALLLALSHPAYAERGLSVTQSGGSGKRIALVIGNGKYQHTEILRKLANPTHDAEDIAKALRGFGFEVIEKKDLNLEGMNSAIAEFSRKLGDSEAALFYFAGHGIQVKGQNYLIPVSANIETEAQIPYQSINVNQLLDEMENGKSRANIVMLDACRNNTFSGKFRSGATRGLAAVSSQPKGTVIVYATDPGNEAADGDGRNGLFTAGLLTAFKGNDLSLHGVLVRTSKEVERGSKQKQTPYISGPTTLQEEFRFGKGTHVASLEPVPTPASAQSKSKEQIEDDTWNAAERINTLNAYETYLSGYPNGRYAVQAKMMLASMKKQPIATSKPEVAAKPAPAASAKAAAKGPAYAPQGDLTWMPVTSEEKNWSAANSYCSNTAINGQSGWRLPTKDELVALYNSRAAKGQGWTLDSIWSSTPAGSGSHYSVFLNAGSVYSNNDTDSYYVTCVR